MIKLYIKLNDSDLSFIISAKRGRKVLGATSGHYKRDLSDKIIKGLAHSISSVQALSAQSKSVEGLDKIMACVNIGKQDNFRAYYDLGSKSFVSNLIVNSVVSVFNRLEKI